MRKWKCGTYPGEKRTWSEKKRTLEENKKPVRFKKEDRRANFDYYMIYDVQYRVHFSRSHWARIGLLLGLDHIKPADIYRLLARLIRIPNGRAAPTKCIQMRVCRSLLTWPMDVYFKNTGQRRTQFEIFRWVQKTHQCNLIAKYAFVYWFVRKVFLRNISKMEKSKSFIGSDIKRVV